MDDLEALQRGCATRAVPAAERAGGVERMAAEIARVPLEILMMKTLAIDRSANRTGMREMREINFEMSLAGHFSNTRGCRGARIEGEGFEQVMAEWKAATRYERSRGRVVLEPTPHHPVSYRCHPAT
jgi:hypothetical protein